jgi:hypothetical protein
MSNKLLGYIKEKDLTHDDVIALIDKHLQREIKSVDDEEPSGEEDKEEIVDESENSTANDETPTDGEIEQFSNSQKKLLEELSDYVETKKKEVDKIVASIKRKEPPEGEHSTEPLTINQEIKKNWFEVDV